MVDSIASSTSTTSLAVDGLISGLDTTSIIEQLVAVQTQRISRYESQQAVETQKITLFQQLQGLYLSVRTAANGLKSRDVFENRLATSSDTSILSVTATKEAALGSHTLTVKQLAAKNQFVSNRYADTNVTTLGTGKLTLTVGSGSSAVKTEITIDSTNNTLDGIKQAINNSGAKVTADILKVDDSTNPYQLIVTANEGGLSNAVSITHDATLKNTVTGEILGSGATTNTQDTDDSDAKTYALRHIPNAGTVTVKVGGTAQKEELVGVSATASDTGGDLRADTTYYYVVSALNGSGEIVRSTVFSATTPTGADDNSIDLQFNDIDGATKYNIYRVDDTQDIGTAGFDIDDFTGQNSYIGTVNDDGSATFSFTDSTDAAQAADPDSLTGTAEGDYTLNESTGAVVFKSAPGGQVTADYEYDLEFVETQAAKDAEIVFGEGANALTIKKSSNTISDVIEGVTIDLKKVDASNPIIVDIKNNTFGLQGTVQSFVDALNEVNSFVEQTAYFDKDTFEKGPLFSNPSLLSIRNRVSGILTGRVDSIPAGKLRSLAEIGIDLSGQTGNYQLNSTVFGDAVNNKLDELRDVFAESGSASDVDIKFVGSTDKTKTTDSLGYIVNITRAAARAETVGNQDISGGITVDETLTIVSDGKTATASLTNGMTAQGAVSAINSALKSAAITDVVAVYDASTGKITLRHEQYGSDLSFTVKSNQANTTSGSSGLGAATANSTLSFSGEDVAGTINGEKATGKGRILTGDSGNANTEGLQIEVSITAANLASEGALQGRVTVSKGIAAELEEYLAFLTDESQEGPIQGAISQSDTRIEDLQESIADYTARAQRQREKLLREFASLEQALGSLQTTSSFLDGQLKQIAATSEAIIKRKSG